MAYKIMVVDDEPANLRLLERLFRRDYQVVAASSGAEALRLLEQHDVALLITDQRMPGMTGIELLGHAARLRPHMVRIILTGYTDVEALVEAINCGQVYRYLTKPWNNEDLRLTAARALEHYEANRGQHELTRVNERLNARLRDTARAFVRTVADALEALDPCLGRVVDAVMQADERARAAGAPGALLAITADHGNADEKRSAEGKPVTAHSLNPVPLVLVGSAARRIGLREGVLADVAPTLLALIGERPFEGITGSSLVETAILPVPNDVGGS